MILPDAFFCFGAALLLLLLPLDWILSAFTAALFHELCHILAVVSIGGKIRRVRICVTGCQLETGPMSPLGSIFSILAGPAGSFLLLLTARHLPKIAICGLFQGAYNLLPVEPLDGGRVLRIFLNRYAPSRAEQVMTAARYCVFAAIGLVLFFRKDKFLPVMVCLAVNLVLLRRKIPCKENRIGLQWY